MNNKNIGRRFCKYFHNKNALIGKTRYSLYSSCCSTDFQGHPRSMIFIPFENQCTNSYQRSIAT